jgi:hypothetical protein
MTGKLPPEEADPSIDDERRAFLARAGKFAVAAPAAALLLAATATKGHAVSGAPPPP